MRSCAQTLAYVGEHGDEIVELLADCEMPPDDIAVRYRLEAFADREVEVLTREPYTLDGEPISVKVPYIGRFVGEHVVQRPLAYAVPGEIAQRLEGHGLVIERPPVTPLLRCRGRDGHRAGVSGRARDPRSRRCAVPGSRVPPREARRCRPAGRWCAPNSSAARSRSTCARPAATTAWWPAGGSTAPAVGAEFPAWRVLAIVHG